MTFSIPGLAPAQSRTPLASALQVRVEGPKKVTKQNLPPISLNPFGVAKRYEHRCSVSQVEAWRGCKRKWGFRSIDKIEGTNRFAARGNAVHAHCENWLVDGIEPPEDDRYGRLVRTGIEHLPLPGTTDVEREFEYISATGVWYVGFLDVWNSRDRGYFKPAVMDHKSTTDLKWSWTKKSGEPLWKNNQCSLYGEVACARDNASEVDLRWLYYIDTKKPKCVPDNDTGHRPNLLRVIQEMDETAHEIERVGRIVPKGHVRDLEPNPNHCEDYGGCPYQGICGLTDAEKMGAIMEQQSIRERLQSQVAAQQGAKVAATPTAATQNVQVGGSVLERMKAAKAAADAAAAEKAASAVPAAASGTFSIPQAALSSPAAAASAPASTVSTPTSTTAGSGLLAQIKAKAAANAATQQAVPDKITQAGMAAGLAAIAEEERLAEQELRNPPVAVLFSASDINPPERSPTPIDDPAELAAANAGELAAKDATVASPTATSETEKRGRGRPAGAKNKPKDPTAQAISTLTDEGYIFGRVFSDALRETRGDIAKATECATAAVNAYREV